MSKVPEFRGEESGKPVHVTTEDADLTVELKRGLAYVRTLKRHDRKSSKTGKR